MTWPVTVLLSTVLLTGGVAAGPASPRFDESRLVWNELEFTASKLGITATSVVRLGKQPTDQARSELLRIDDASLQWPSGPMVASIVIETELRKRLSTIEAWFDPSTGQAFQRDKLETGRKAYQRTDRLGLGAVHRRRRQPLDNDEVALPPDVWSDREDERVALPTVSPDAVVILPSSLFYLVATAPLEHEGDRVQLYSFARQSLDRLTLEVLGRTPIDVDYRVTRNGKGRTEQRKSKVDALCIAVRAEALQTDDSDASFQFLGLKGDVEIFLDPTTRLPLQVSGSTGFLGRVDVMLTRAVLTTPSG